MASKVQLESIVIYLDNLEVVRRCNREIDKSLIEACEGILSVIEIRELIDKMSIKVSIEHVRGYIKTLITF